MFNPFQKLVDAFNRWAEAKVALREDAEAQQALKAFTRTLHDTAKCTDFEKLLVERFNAHRNDPQYRTLYVSIRNSLVGKYCYEAPLTGLKQKADFAVAALNMGSPLAAVQFEQKHGRMVVMMLNLHGAELEQQIPNWEPGRITFPDQYLSFPIINASHTAGLLVASPYGTGIITAEQAKSRHYTPPVNTQALDLPAEFKRNVSCLREDGSSYTPKDKVIRGVFVNENPQLPAPRMKAPRA